MGVSAIATRTALAAQAGAAATLAFDVADPARAAGAAEVLRRRIRSLGGTAGDVKIDDAGFTMAVRLPAELDGYLPQLLPAGVVSLHAVDDATLESLRGGLPAALTEAGVGLSPTPEHPELETFTALGFKDLAAALPLPDGGTWATMEVPPQSYGPNRFVALPLKAAAVTSTHIARCSPEAEAAEWAAQVTVRLTPDGAKAFGALTGRLVGKRLAIVLDGALLSAPIVMERIEGAFSLTVGSLLEGRLLAAVLREGPLPSGVQAR